MSTPTIKKPSLSGPGLKKQGVVVLQTFFIFIFSWLEMWLRNGAGILTGLVICLVTYGGVAYGRPGTRYVAATTPPLAYAASSLIYTILSDGLHPARIGDKNMADLNALVDQLSELTVLEAAELSKMLEEKWGVSAAAPVAVAAVAPEGKSVYVNCIAYRDRLSFACERTGVRFHHCNAPSDFAAADIEQKDWNHGTPWTLTNHGTFL